MASKTPNMLALTEELAAIIGRGYQLESAIRGGLQETTEEQRDVSRWWHIKRRYAHAMITKNPGRPTFAAVVQDIERWRQTAGEFLRDKLPGTGASVFGLSKFGTVGQGPVVYEYSRLCNSIERLTQVLRHLPELVERSRGR
ncbi:MAG TPA: hypothetical protein VKA83_09155 [Methylomirabilota bacterium]|nr:hypothetical protein [Methylomirabilota bacterium]